MKTKSYTYFIVSAEGRGGHWSQEGYSKYNERRNLEVENKLPPGEQAYGYEQAIEHAKEIKEHIYEGKKHNENLKFQIESVTTVTTVIPVTI